MKINTTIISSILTILIILCGCNESGKHSNENISNFFLGLPVNCSYNEALNYLEKLSRDSIISSLRNDSDRINTYNRLYLSPDEIYRLKAAGIDSVTNSHYISCETDLTLEINDKYQTYNAYATLFFYNNNVLAIQIEPSDLFSSTLLSTEAIINLYAGKYGTPDYENKQSEVSHAKRDIHGIANSFYDKSTYITWETNFYTEETAWSYKNASIKIVTFHYTTMKDYVSEYSYNKAENILGEQYGSWSESYLTDFLQQSNVIKHENTEHSDIYIYYINTVLLQQVKKDIIARNSSMQIEHLKRQEMDMRKDSLINNEKKKKFTKQRI